MAQRNSVISIIKGLAIILMVVGHAEAPELITNFIYTFHMPVFFICAGYFFSRKYVSDPWSFISKRFRGLYLPFLKWSIVFLVLHNLFFEIGLLNEDYGNWTGGVTHPYSFSTAMRRLALIVTSMSGYDEFLAGAFWFFRGLLVASIVFLVIYRLLISRLTEGRAVTFICLSVVGFVAFRLAFDFKIATIPNGGLRETWGLFFFGVGVLFRRYEHIIREHWALALAYFTLLCGAAWLHLSGMNNAARWRDLWSLPVTGTIGFLFLHWIAGAIDGRQSKMRDLLVFIGDNTLYVFIFHIISFKAVSLLKVWWYGLDPGQIGCHMVIHYNHTDFFWVLYSVVGVALPLAVLSLYRSLKSRRLNAAEPDAGA